MKEIGKIIFKMEKVPKLGQMGQFIKVVIRMDKKKEKDFFNGKMELFMKENLILIK